MTVPVPDQLEYISDADGVTKDFPYPKRFLEKDEIVVLLRDADGVDTPQILNTHYTIAGSSWPNGGMISFVNAPQAPNKVVLHRMTQAKQTVDLENNQRNDAPSVERQLDRLTMAIQDRSWLGVETYWALLAEVDARVHGDNILNDRVDQEIFDRTNADEALSALIGNIGSGNAPLFDTNQAASMALIDPLVNAIRTAGYSVVGDGGAALYKRVATEPTHAGKVQSADGTWWELVDREVYLAQFGVFGEQDVGDIAQLALDYLEVRGGGTLVIPPENFLLSKTLRVPSHVTVRAYGAKLTRSASINCMLMNKSDGTQGGYTANKNIKVLGGTFDGNSSAFPTDCTLMAFGHCADIEIADNQFLNTPGTWHALELNAVTRATVTRNRFRAGGADLLEGECIQLDAAISSGPFPWFGPYDDTPCFDIKITGNTVEQWATAVGSHSEPANVNLRHTLISITKNFFSVSRGGVVISRWSDVDISDNRIQCYLANDTSTDSIPAYGIHARPVQNGRTTAIRIRNNVIDGFKRGTTANGNSRCIFISGTLTTEGGFNFSNIVIEGNYCVNNGRHGVTANYCDTVQIRGNTVNFTSLVGIYLYGCARSEIKNNIVTGQQISPNDDIRIDTAGQGVSTQNIVTGNMAGRYTLNTPSSLITDNIATISMTGTSAGGRVGPNLVAGSWV